MENGQLIAKDMTIGEVIKKYPSVIATLQATGVHCVGCHVAYDESIEQGFRSHGMSEDQINQALVKLNESAVPNDGKQTLKIAPNAVKKIKEFTNGMEGYGLRLKVISGGCSGMQYAFEISKPSDKDVVIFEDGARVIVDKDALSYVEGSMLDFADALQDAGFKVSNPKATSSCGCGHSFSM